MTNSGSQPDHDELRRALRRAFPAEQAPQALRERITAMLQNQAMWSDDMPEPAELTRSAGHIASQPDPSNPYARIAWLGNLFHGARRIAIAACIAGLAMGIGLFVATPTGDPRPSEQPQYAQSPVAPFLQAAVVRHDELLQVADPTQTSGRSLVPLQEVRTELKNRLAAPMPEADISSQGWQLVGGKTMGPADGCVAQLFYRRGQQTLSVFIISPDPLGRRIQIPSTSQKDHLITCRESGPLTICVVGYSPDGKLTAGEVDRVADLIASH